MLNGTGAAQDDVMCGGGGGGGAAGYIVFFGVFNVALLTVSPTATVVP